MVGLVELLLGRSGTIGGFNTQDPVAARDPSMHANRSQSKGRIAESYLRKQSTRSSDVTLVGDDLYLDRHKLALGEYSFAERV